MENTKGKILSGLFFSLLFCCCSVEQETKEINDKNRDEKTLIHELNKEEISKGKKIIAIEGATLIDGNGGDAVPNSCIIIRDHKIETVGVLGEVDIPKEAEVINGQGMSILPGLIDAHYHNSYNQEMPGLVLSHGVTTVRDPGAWIDFYDSVRALGQPIPRLFLTGPHIDTYPPAYPGNSYLIKDPKEGQLAVKEFVQQGATAIKVYLGLSIEMIKAICATAHGYGIPVTAHLETANAIYAIEAGLDGIEHITSFGTALLPKRKVEKYKQLIMKDVSARERGRYEVWNSLNLNNQKTDSLIQFLANKKTFVSPTLAIFEKQWDRGDSVEVNGFNNMVTFVGKARKGGVRIVVGSHTWVPYAERGYAYFREIELLKKAGLTNSEIIVAATIENARFFRIEERLGSIEPGKLADLILVKGNPMKNINDLRKVQMVMLNGVWVEGGP